VGSDGELEEEVDMDRIITDQDREQAAELKVKANKAFAGKSPIYILVEMKRILLEIRLGRGDMVVLRRGCLPSLLSHMIPSEAELINQPRSSTNPSTSTRKLSP
jgi:hypothetical protein